MDVFLTAEEYSCCFENINDTGQRKKETNLSRAFVLSIDIYSEI
jgi:hypothetical protein